MYVACCRAGGAGHRDCVPDLGCRACALLHAAPRAVQEVRCRHCSMHAELVLSDPPS